MSRPGPAALAPLWRGGCGWSGIEARRDATTARLGDERVDGNVDGNVDVNVNVNVDSGGAVVVNSKLGQKVGAASAATNRARACATGDPC